MKILFVSCAYTPYHRGGVAKLLINLSMELTKRKHKVYVFSLLDESSIKESEIKNIEISGHQIRFINIPGSSLTDFYGRYRKEDYYNPGVNPAFKSYLDEIKPDVVHFHAIQGLGANLITEAHELGYPTILTMHDMWWFCPNLFMTDLNLKPCNQNEINSQKCINCLENLNEISGFKNVDFKSFVIERDLYLNKILENDVGRLLTNSQILKKNVQHNTTCNIQVNENGIIKVSEIIEKSVDPHNIVFGFVSGKSELKGYNLLMDAFRSIKLSNWELHIYGFEKMGLQNWYNILILSLKNRTVKSDLLRLINNKKKKSISEKIKYFPSYSDSEKYTTLNTLDIIIIPSIIRESFSLIAREGLMLKKPIICSDCGGPEEVIENNVNGFVFKTNNVEDLKTKICAILENPSLIYKLKSNIKIHKIISIEEQVNDLETVYNQISKGPKLVPKTLPCPTSDLN
ncbi:MAG: glycosyltransferase [Candidatus Methanoperedens sp.]|nr:glycosyltransferase [Candidatus Methanoperedens sp.]